MKILKYLLCVALLLCVLCISASAAEDKAPEFPDDNEHWVIFFDESIGAFSLATASIGESFDCDPILSWGDYLESLGSVPLENVRCYYLSSDASRWIYYEDHMPYEDFVRRAIASSVPVYDNNGRLYLKATSYDAIKSNIPTLYKGYLERTEALVGHWVGTYGAPQGKMGVDLLIYRTSDLLRNEEKLAYISKMANDTAQAFDDDLFPIEYIRKELNKIKGEYVAVYCYYPSHDTPNAESGVYISSLDYTYRNGSISIIGTEWIAHQTYGFAHLLYTENKDDRLTATVYGGYHLSDLTDYGKFEAVRQGSAAENKYIAVFATQKDLTLQVGDEMNLGFAPYSINGDIGPTTKMAIAISNPEIISVSDFIKTEVGQAVTVTGLTKGASYITVTDPESGASQSVLITVEDEYCRNYTYSIYEISEVYPPVKYDKNVPTNIYNLNGLYVRNYRCEDGNDGYFYITFDAYNTSYLIGAVEVYDENGRFSHSAEIDKFTDISSIKDAFSATYYLVTKAFDGTFHSYDQPACSKLTQISIKVPYGGGVIITNNPEQSHMVRLYNYIDLTLSAISRTMFFEDLLANGDPIQSICDSILKDPSVSEQIFAASSALLNSLQKNIVKAGVKDAMKLLIEDFDSMLRSLDIDMRQTLLDMTDGMTEEGLEILLGPAGRILDLMFETNEVIDLLVGVQQLSDFRTKPYATLYSHEFEYGDVNKHGVVIFDNGNIDYESTLQVFKVFTDDPTSFSGTSCEFYNIAFVKDNQYVQPSGMVEVRIPIPKGIKLDKIEVYRQETDGSWTALGARIDSGYLVFETDHFSLYAIAGEGDILTINTLPSKLTYTVGDTVDPSGLTVSVNGVPIEDGYFLSPSTIYSTSDSTITVWYNGLSATFNVTLKSAETGMQDTPTVMPPADTATESTDGGRNIVYIVIGAAIVLAALIVISKKRKR